MSHRSAVVFSLLLVLGCEDRQKAPEQASASSAPSAADSLATAPTASSTASAAVADDTATARRLTQKFAAALKKELMQGMSAGGPENAIAVCNEKAPGIGDAVSTAGWTIGRTSLKLRNPKNAPDDWEKRMLEKMEADNKSGTPIAELEVSEVVEGEFRYMKAIGTAGMCVTCHGATIAPEVDEALAEKYPKDAARGFAVGDIRGAFTVRKKL